MSDPNNDSNVTDIAENVPNMPSRDSDDNAGTVVSADGTRVTLGDEGRATKPASPTNRGTNLRNMKF